MSQNQIKKLLIVIFQCSIALQLYLFLVLIETSFNLNCFNDFTLIEWLLFILGLISTLILGLVNYSKSEFVFHDFKDN